MPANLTPHPFPPSVPENLPQELIDNTISMSRLTIKGSPPILRHNMIEVNESKHPDIGYDTFPSWGSKDSATLADIDDVQKVRCFPKFLKT
jgi:hypothetical protein